MENQFISAWTVYDLSLLLFLSLSLSVCLSLPHTHRRTHTQTCAPTHAHIHTRTHTRAHTHTQTHIHTHTTSSQQTIYTIILKCISTSTGILHPQVQFSPFRNIRNKHVKLFLIGCAIVTSSRAEKEGQGDKTNGFPWLFTDTRYLQGQKEENKSTRWWVCVSLWNILNQMGVMFYTIHAISWKYRSVAELCFWKKAFIRMLAVENLR